MIKKLVVEQTEDNIKTPKVYFPKNNGEVTKMAEDLLNHQPIIINLTALKYEVRMRVLDFICGVAYVLGADRKLLDNSIYLFSFEDER